MPCRDGMACKASADLAPVLLDQDGHGHDQVPPVYSSMRRADSTTSGRHGGQCWKLSVSGSPGVMSMSIAPTFSASNTRESGISCCTSALVVVLPTPWAPLSQRITDATLAAH